MAANNYCGFTYGGTQYGAPAAGAAYPAAQAGYAVAPAATAAYGTQRAGYDQAYQAAATPGSFASAAANPGATTTYDYGYGRQYDVTKTYYQQAGATPGYTAPAYTATTTATKTHYSAPPTRNIIPPATTKAATATTTQNNQTVTNVTQNTAPKQAQATTNTTTYTNYDAALYSAATMYVAQQTNKANANANWQYKKPGPGAGMNKQRAKPQPRPQQLHYCEVCKISCAGPQTYREHLEGQKHKKREASLKMMASATATNQNRGNNYHCELCDVTCTGNDAYAAHVRGSKHQKVVKLHQKLGKPIPSSDPKKLTKINFVPAGEGKEGEAAAAEIADDEPISEDIKPVGVEYIEELKDAEGKILSFNCKLCECKFNDPNAKEMHMKGRRHRLQYKRKVQPDLVVDIKPTPRQRRIAEARAQRALMQAEYWNSRRNENDDEDPMYWDERRRFDDEFEYMNWMQRNFPGPGPRGPPMGRPGPPMGHPFYGMMPGRRPESSDDRHVVARHAEIYPKEEELQTIQRIVSHTERALKFVSDALTETKSQTNETKANGTSTTDAKGTENKENNGKAPKEDGRDNQMFSFQKEAEGGNIRILKGVMRVGLLAKGLLLQGDNVVQLVVLCAEKPVLSLLDRVANELPIQLRKVSEEHQYNVSTDPPEGAVLVSDGTITVKVSLTSPLLREQDTNNATTAEQTVQKSEDLLPREPCLQALAALRHAKWFQARATGLQSCVMIMRILRDLCQRVPTLQPLSQWAMELLVEKVISSAGIPLSPGDCLRRVMEALSTGFLINGPGILDPCEKDPHDALQGLSKQQREDITVSAQQFLRYIAFRQIYKVLGMDPLPAPKFQARPWRLHRKRRRSGEGGDSEGDGKMVKKEGGEERMETDPK
ncbi:zinc finger RNA-binding protein 2 isoform X1 [Hermetia illucens]|uniref:zinc finger RNA-binding protein 2 isoform X1 n=1 Tax=Hermetia illucens TaxID=343691 RepID=UPI0018CC47BD|nr:zinc finger RNA-binding protein 2 isoform X1 [Hermetia illucens]XP_037922385.1 zinc finger RNA-binding protein 2 isoform X1 [Hermetia illucens]